MKTVRAFFCLPLPEPLLRGLSAWTREAAATLPGARWVSRRNLHVTLRFCGEIDETTVKALDKRLSVPVREALAAMPELEIAGIGSFGHPPRVLWAGLSGGLAALHELNALIEQACRDEGLEPDDKRFTPHLTLARFSSPAPARLERLPKWTLAGATWKPDRVIFMRSVLSPAGPSYSPLFVYKNE